MLATFVAFALLASADGSQAAKPARNPERMVCKYDLQPGSRLAKRKVCMTVAQWAEWKQNEQLYLLRNQFNGSPK
jgi:hypothetical protein